MLFDALDGAGYGRADDRCGLKGLKLEPCLGDLLLNGPEAPPVVGAVPVELLLGQGFFPGGLCDAGAGLFQRACRDEPSGMAIFCQR